MLRMLFFCICLLSSLPLYSQDLIVLCYHDVRDDVDLDIDKDPMAVHTLNLAAQFEWLRVNGYTPVSLDDIENRLAEPLPEKAVLLTFDDGYLSFYTHIFPLLQLYDYPAVMALVGSWLAVEKGGDVLYGNELRKREDFLASEHILEMVESGLVEFASHSFNLHKGVIANPQANLQPSAVTRLYDAEESRYESSQTYKKRIEKDLKQNHRAITRLTGGVEPRAMVWPYGAWSIEAEEIARSLGYTYFFVLGKPGMMELDAGRVHRKLIIANPDLGKFAALFEQEKPVGLSTFKRAAHIDLDYVFDPDETQQNKNLDILIERIKRLGISTVYLQAFADPDGDGNANALYFENTYLPVRADLFNRVSWQLETRAEVTVFAWMPVLAFDFGDDFYQQHGVKNAIGESAVSPSYKRLSPFSEEAGTAIKSIYRQLAQNAPFDGLLFHDDALLFDDEDFHPAAAAFFNDMGLDPALFSSWRQDAESVAMFTNAKKQLLNDFTFELIAEVRRYKPEVKTARNFYSMPILQPESESWYAQNAIEALAQYDQVAIMAMPWMEAATDPLVWTRALIEKLDDLSAEQRQRIVVELQAKDWNTGEAIPEEVLQQLVHLWKQSGFYNFAWYPDDFHRDKPSFRFLFKNLSLEDYPYRRK